MLVSKETSQAWKERHDLMKLMEKQHQEMRNKLLETKIGIEPIHSPINRVESQIRTLKDLYQVIGPLPQLKQIGEDLKSMYDKMLDIPEMEQPAVSPVELYEAKLSVIQDALSYLEQGQARDQGQGALETLRVGIEPSEAFAMDTSYRLWLNGQPQEGELSPGQVFEYLEERSQTQPLMIHAYAHNRTPYEGVYRSSDPKPSFQETGNTVSVVHSESGSYEFSVNGEPCGSRNQPMNAFALLGRFSREHPVQVTYQDQMDLSLSEEDLVGLSQETGIGL